MSGWESSISSGDGGSSEFPWQYVVVPFMAFFCELIDSSLGMGYGTTLTPVLLTPVFGFERAVIVQSILVSEAATGLLATVFHALFHNINIGINLERFLPRKLREHVFGKKEQSEGERLKGAHGTACAGGGCSGDSGAMEAERVIIVESSPPLAELSVDEKGAGTTASPDDEEEEEQDFDDGLIKEQRDLSKTSPWYRMWFFVRSKMTVDLQVVIIMSLFGVLGTIVSSGITVINTSKQKLAVKLYIGFMVLSMGVIMIFFTAFRIRVKYASWKICILGLITGFNKGISGGGYGPMAVSGQVILGRPNRNAIAVTSTTEFVICISGIVCDFVVGSLKGKMEKTKEHYTLVPYLLIGACLSVPFAAYCTRIVKAKKLRYVVGSLTLVLGIYSVVVAFLQYYKIWSGGVGS